MENYFKILPDEILNNIFNYLDTKSLINLWSTDRRLNLLTDYYIKNKNFIKKEKIINTSENILIEYIYNDEEYGDISVEEGYLSINCISFLENGEKIDAKYLNMDMNYDNGGVIEGLYETIKELKLGDFVRVKIPYIYAYGEDGIPDLIPRRSNLIYYLQITFIEEKNNIYEYPNIINLEKIIKYDDIEKIRSEIKNKILSEIFINKIEINSKKSNTFLSYLFNMKNIFKH